MSDFLAVLAILKNERTILPEWLEHHIWQGVERFYLVDNGSDDDPLTVLRRYGDRIRYTHDARRHVQGEIYNGLLPAIDCEWLAVIDLDEFAFGTQRRLCEELAAVTASMVYMPWHMFGTDCETQPASVRASCTRRWPDVCQSGKYIVRRASCSWLGIHDATVSGDKIVTPAIRVHHYPTQSWEWFRDVKMTRGDAAIPTQDYIRDEGYFRSYNELATLEDRTLADQL